MSTTPVTIALPIADRRRSYSFYCAGLGFTAFGAPADDGVPEPLQLSLNDGVSVMLIPTGGFGWVLGGREVARPGQSECIVTLALPGAADVDAMVDRARQAGAEIVAEPTQEEWGYAATFADPDGHVWQIIQAAVGTSA